MYEERFYRQVSRPHDLICYEVIHKETDILCCTKKDISQHIKERLIHYRYQLDEYIKLRPEFKDSFIPISYDKYAPPIVKKMIEASSIIGVGPLACVAGAIAEFIGNDISSLTDEFILENGGDIYLKTKKQRKILIYAKDSPFSKKIALNIKPSEKAYGICTSSGTVGHSLSFGKTDAVCVIGESSLFCDGLATYIGNIVKKRDDISNAIEKAKTFKEIKGILIIMKDHLGVWGDIQIVTP
ncbi:MAG TPA: UPF0280 family protein [Syntrophorhabdaceae bacterium]|nr:UPF0280 family protein [Syntrophorhabdaceae bacterium]